ncbi:uncharacterized protein MELLADRAFT_95580 [Melampsora larici-populina 98AG31]|uniref:Uncharacterized protein n=1 Tax=Melampsora larici-populina (strain 98AG31 / pathotype 3-4-7) TaxID=747676 RepID=F4S9V2_MELLP|nr:uncharacterized protein MELLADRAFT_95580 [Melampsora larici-populina 98AG31]EGF98596.1 hypothetical protein MELLADRAFT_95580 [Melampsora larici-populina 98AG31]
MFTSDQLLSYSIILLPVNSFLYLLLISLFSPLANCSKFNNAQNKDEEAYSTRRQVVIAATCFRTSKIQKKCAPSASSSRPRKNSNLPSNNRSNTTNLSTLAHSQPTNNSLALAHSQPTNATSFSQPHVLTNSQKAYLKHVTETLDLSSKAHEKALKATRPENEFIGTIGYLSYIQQTIEQGLSGENLPSALAPAAASIWRPSDILKASLIFFDVVRRDFNALIMDVKIQAYSCIRDSKRSAIRQCFDALCKKYIKSRDKQFIKAHYPTGYETPDGAEAVKTITDWANRCATDTRSRLRHCLLIDVKPSGNEASMNAMPSLQQLTSLVRFYVSKDFKHRLAFLRIHAVYTMQNPSTDHYEKKHGKLYKTAFYNLYMQYNKRYFEASYCYSQILPSERLNPPTETEIKTEYQHLKEKSEAKQNRHQDEVEEEDNARPAAEDDLSDRLGDEDDFLPDDEDDFLPDDEDDGLPDNEDDGLPDDEDDGLPDNEDDGSLDDEDDGSLEI